MTPASVSLTSRNAPDTLLLDIATRNIAHLGPLDTLMTAARQTGQLGISSLLILDAAGRPLGIVTKHDILRAMHRSLPTETPLAEVMSSPVITVSPAISCHDAYQICLDRNIRHLVINSPRGRALAVVSETDFRRHLDADAFAGQETAATAMNRTVNTLKPDAPLHAALSLMAANCGSTVVVTADACPGGIVTEGDVVSLCCSRADILATRLDAIMSAPLLTVAAETSLAAAAERMLVARVRQLPVVDEAGALLGILDSRDLTKVLAMKQGGNLPASEQGPVMQLLDKAPFPIVITRLHDGHIRYCNPRLAKQLGVDRATLLNVPATRFYRDPGEREKLITLAGEQGSLSNLDVQLIRSNGEPIDAIVSSEIIRFENEPALLSAINDITDWRRTERDLRERIKEQECLFAISAATEDPYQPIAEQLERITHLIGPGYQYPGITEARLECVGLCATTPGFRETPWMLTAETTDMQGAPMRLTVAYLEERPQEDEGPFFKEERLLADAILHRLLNAMERRQSNEQLRERDQLISAMFAQTTDAILLVDQQTQCFVDFNSVAHQGLGYSREEFARLTILDIQADHSPEQIAANITNALEGQYVQFETKHRHADGTIREVVLTLQSIKLNERSLLTAVWQDITEQKARESEIQQTARSLCALNRYYAMLTNVSEAVVRIRDPHRLYQEACRILVEIGGFALAWAGTVTDNGQIMPVAKAGRSDGLMEECSGAIAGETPAGMAIQSGKVEIVNDIGGDLRANHWQTAPLHRGYRSLGIIPILVGGRLQVVISVYATEVHLFNQELVEMFQRLASTIGLALEAAASNAVAAEEQHYRQTLVDSVAGLFYVIDSSGHLVLWNRTAEQLTRRSAEELASMPVLDHFRPEDRQLVADRIQEAFLTGESSEEAIVVAKDGLQTPFFFNNRRVLIKGRPLIVGSAVDISAKVKAMRDLEESEKRLQVITDSVLDPILMLDPDGAISYWNPAAERVLGYSADEALGQNLHRLLAPERYQSRHQAAYEVFRRTGKGNAIGRSLDMSALHKDGREIDVSLSLSAVFLEDAWNAVGILHDISEIKRQQAEVHAALQVAEQANQEKNEVLAHLETLVATRTKELYSTNELLQISQERLSLAMEASTDGLWDWNILEGSVYFSPAYERMYGYEPGELPCDLKGHWLDLLHPDDRKWVATTALERLERYGGYDLEFRMRNKSGHYLWILSRGKVVSRDAAGRPTRAVGTHTDLTAHKQIELELRTANKEQRAIFEAAATGIVFIKNRQILRCNRQSELLFGCGPGELNNKTTRCWYASDDEYQEMHQNIASQLQEHGRYQGELQLMRKDGSRFWSRVNAQAIDSGDLAKGEVGMVEDITEEREASAALRQAKEVAEASTRAKSEFLANMSHEIRTPMNAIIGFAYLLKREPLSPRQAEQLGKLTDASARLLRIINDILDLSKIEASKMSIDIEDFEPARVVDHVCGIVADRAVEKGLRLHVDLDSLPLMLRGDGARLSQVLLNLMGNAVKFTEQGRIEILARVVVDDSEQIRVRFEVRDTGIGMTSEQTERIFVAFEQADSSTTRRFGGTGLGLAISKHLVELMGGIIGVESTPGSGTLFWIELPFIRSAQTPALRLPAGTLQRMHALVIDDDEDTRLIVAGMLTELGMRAETALTGEGGLEAVAAADRAADPYDLLIIDWQLPGLDGIETASRLQALDLSVPPTFLVMTAYGDRLPREQAELAGIHRVMAKPVTPSVLHDTLAEIILPVQGQVESISVMTEELAKRRGGHILLVEDNPINQEMAQALLESLGMQVSLADNGQAAVEMAGAAAFDLVCMDIQMPVMDGLEATRAIRRLPGWESVPIVAMTANAFREDRERCLQAGMNDHIAKPVEHEALQDLLIRWMPARQLSVSSEPSADRSTIRIKEEGTLLAALEAIDGLDATAGLRRMVGNQDRYIRVLTRFIDDHGGDGEVLGELAVSGVTSRLRTKSHALKGAAATLGMARIQQAAAELEAMCETGETRAAIEYQVNLVRQELAELTTGLAKLLPVPSPRTVVPSTLDVDELAGVLARLVDLLRMGDTAATDLFEQARPGLYAACGPLAEQLDRHIQALEYEEAGKIALELFTSCSRNCRSPMANQ